MIPVSWYLILSAALFTIGLVGVLTRRNMLVIFMCVELMMNAVNVSLVAFARSFTTGTTTNGILQGRGPAGVNFAGDNFFVFVITIAAAEAAVGLAIIVALARQKDTVDVNEIDLLKD